MDFLSFPARVLRGLLIQFIQTFALPGTPPVWYRRYLPLLLLVIVATGGAWIGSAGTTVLVNAVKTFTGTPDKAIEPGVRVALMVAWLAFVAFSFTLANLVLPALRRAPLHFAVPETMYSWLAGAAAVSMGLLIGISIFR